jgi:hypothetical protein
MLRKFTPSPALLIAVIALVMAIAGTGYAATKLPARSVGTTQLKNKSVTTPKLKNDTVSSAKLKQGSVSSREIAGGSVTAAHVAPDSLTGSQINESSLGTVPSAGSAPVQGLSYVGSAVSLPGNTGMTTHIECPPDRRPLSGGAKVNNPANVYMVDEYPQGNGWTVDVANPDPSDSGFTIYATCAQATQGTSAAPKMQGKATGSRFRVER